MKGDVLAAMSSLVVARGLAVESRTSAICLPPMKGKASPTSAATPVTKGAAIDVPLIYM